MPFSLYPTSCDRINEFNKFIRNACVINFVWYMCKMY